MNQRIYIDTSVFGGYFDKEFSSDTILFFDRVKKEGTVIVISDLLEAELLKAPDYVKNLLGNFREHQIEKVKLSVDASQLADKYIAAKVVGKTSKADCQPIAIATLCHIDVLVSWNFKHIVNLDRIRGYNGINFQCGYKMIEIRTPKEVLKYENED